MKKRNLGFALATLVSGLPCLTGCPGPPPPMNNDVTLAPPDKGFQLATPSFTIDSGTELQACYFFKAPDINNGQPYYIDQMEVAQNPGSHHMNVFRVNTIMDLKPPSADGTGVVVNVNDGTHCVLSNLKKDCPCFYSGNWSDWPLLVNSQQSTDNKNFVLQLPPRVGHKITPGEQLMLQTHYVNASTQKTPGHGKAIVNFHEMADQSNAIELGTLFATQQSISICKDNPTPKFSGFCKLNSPNKPVTIIAANGHFHSRGTDFTICPWDGLSTDACTTNKFYESKTWDDPPMMTGLNVQVMPGGGVSWTCSYQFAPSPGCADGCSCLKDPVNCCYKFGPVVETSEHCNAFVYYYPKLNNSDITCQ